MPTTPIVRERRARRVSILLTAWLGVCVSAFGQITSTWFDINPNNSNGDRNSSSSGRINHVGAAGDFSKVYAASEWGGLYQSFDQGNTWVKINTFIPSATWDVKVDPQNSQKVYATSFFDGRVNPQSGISVSNDAGATWSAVNVARVNSLTCTKAIRKTQPSAWQIAIDPTNTANVFVGTSCGLAHSLDAGGSWTFIDPSPVDNAEQIYAVIVQGGGTVDVIGDNGHLRSTNNGANWTAIGGTPLGPLPGNSGDTSSIVASPRENYVLIAETRAQNIFESDDGGATWPSTLTLPLLGSATNVQGRIPFLKTNQLSSSSQFDVWYGDINVFKATAVTPSTLAPGGGPRVPVNSWSSVQDGAHDDTGDILFNPRFTAGACPAVFSGDGGIYRNTNPNNPDCQNPSWTQPNITPHATWIWGFDGVKVSQGQHALTYGLQDDGGWAATNVAEGQNPPAPDWNNYVCCDLMDNTEGAGKIVAIEGFSQGNRGGFPMEIRNQDGSSGNGLNNYPSAQNFTAFNNGHQNAPFGDVGYVVNVCGQTSCTGGDVYATSNFLAGPSWTDLKSPTSATSGTGNIKVANLSGQPNVFYHTGNGDPESQGLLFRSTIVGANVGSNWTQLPLPGNIGTVTAYDVDPTDANHVIISGIDNATQNFQIFITPDFGTTWTRLQNLENLMLGVLPTTGTAVFVNQASVGRATGFLNFSTYWQPSLFKFDPLDSTTIVAGAIDSGVFVSLDNGVSWQTVSNNINPTSASPGIPAPIFAYFSPGRFNASTNAFDVWVGTRGAGVHKVVLERPAPAP